MIYNVLIKTSLGTGNILGINGEQLKKLQNAYFEGKESVTLGGVKYLISDLLELRIFEHTKPGDRSEHLKYYLNNIHFSQRTLIGEYLPTTTLVLMGKEVTHAILEDREYGELQSKIKQVAREKTENFVDESVMKNLQQIASENFDFKKLIRLCEELNSNYSSENWYSASMLLRAIIDHVPPLFNCKTFENVVSNYNGGKSFKDQMGNLQNQLKPLADGNLHVQIRKKEVLITKTQVSFQAPIGTLLNEIIRISS